jgi:hypothetical protein
MSAPEVTYTKAEALAIVAEILRDPRHVEMSIRQGLGQLSVKWRSSKGAFEDRIGIQEAYFERKNADTAPAGQLSRVVRATVIVDGGDTILELNAQHKPQGVLDSFDTYAVDKLAAFAAEHNHEVCVPIPDEPPTWLS